MPVWPWQHQSERMCYSGWFYGPKGNTSRKHACDLNSSTHLLPETQTTLCLSWVDGLQPQRLTWLHTPLLMYDSRSTRLLTTTSTQSLVELEPLRVPCTAYALNMPMAFGYDSNTIDWMIYTYLPATQTNLPFNVVHMCDTTCTNAKHLSACMSSHDHDTR